MSDWNVIGLGVVVLVALVLLLLVYALTKKFGSSDAEKSTSDLSEIPRSAPPPETATTPDPGKPSSKPQHEERSRPGMSVTPDLASREAWEIVQAKLKRRAEVTNTKAEACEADRDALADTCRRWEAFCDLNTYMVVIRDGEQVVGELLEFENVSIENKPTPSVKIDALRPKVHGPTGNNPAYFEFETEITMRSAQILEAQKVPIEIDMFDMDELENWRQKAKVLAAKYQ